MCVVVLIYCFFFFKQKTAYEMRISDWSSDVCSSDLDQRSARWAVSLHQPIGNIGADRDTQRAEQADAQRRRGCAIDVIIAKYRHRLLALDHVGEPRRGGVHVPEIRRASCTGRVCQSV